MKRPLAALILILALLVWMSVAGERATLPDLPEVRKFKRLAWGAVIAVFILLMTGAYMRSIAAGFACAGWPTCNGELAPFGRGTPGVDIHLAHRFVAYLVAAHVIFTMVRGWNLRDRIPGLTASNGAFKGPRDRILSYRRCGRN